MKSNSHEPAGTDRLLIALLVTSLMAIGFLNEAGAQDGGAAPQRDSSQPTSNGRERRTGSAGAPADKREFRPIHDMDEMHRMGGAPGVGLEGGESRCRC